MANPNPNPNPSLNLNPNPNLNPIPIPSPNPNQVRLYVATLKGGAPTADQILVERLRADLGRHAPFPRAAGPDP